MKIERAKTAAVQRTGEAGRTAQLGAQLMGKDYLQDSTRGGYRLGISQAISNTVSGFFTDQPAAKALPLKERAAIAQNGLERLAKQQPDLFKVTDQDSHHARLEKGKLNDSLALLRQVAAGGTLPPRGWGDAGARALVGDMLIADDR